MRERRQRHQSDAIAKHRAPNPTEIGHHYVNDTMHKMACTPLSPSVGVTSSARVPKNRRTTFLRPKRNAASKRVDATLCIVFHFVCLLPLDWRGFNLARLYKTATFSCTKILCDQRLQICTYILYVLYGY